MHRDTLDDTSVVHEDIDVTYLSVDLLYECLHSVLVSYVANVTLHILDASLFVVCQTALQRCVVDVVEDDGFDACSYESLSNVETNTLRSTGNPGVLTL